ncbi:MAG: hypothetical protein P4L11_00445, partial [Geothrix sp.]|nr:hypothetical protein [Geothrix sp.]
LISCGVGWEDSSGGRQSLLGASHGSCVEGVMEGGKSAWGPFGNQKVSWTTMVGVEPEGPLKNDQQVA